MSVPRDKSKSKGGSDGQPAAKSQTNVDTRSGSRRRSKALQIVWGERPIIHIGGNIYKVPSQSGGDDYTCNMNRVTCECKYWFATRNVCKHLEAATLFIAKEQLDDDGHSTVGPLRDAFSQPWYYDRVKTREPKCVRELLRCLGSTFHAPAVDGELHRRGRPAASMGDLIIAGTHAAYNNKPSRKAIDDILFAEELLACKRGTIAPITLRRYMGSTELTVLIRAAIRQVALCTRRLDTEFAIDSTYLKTPLSQIFVQQRGPTGRMIVKKNLNCKAHFAAGLESLVIYGCKVVDGEENDQLGFIPTLEQFESYVRVETILADAGYCSAEHYAHVEKLGAKAYIDFAVDAQPQKSAESAHFNSQYRLWKHDHDVWLETYSYRYLIECVNSVFKRTTKRIVRARLKVPRENEILLAVLSYNLCRLVIARVEHGVEIPWADERALATIDEITTGYRPREHVA